MSQKVWTTKLYSFFNFGAWWGRVVNATPRLLLPREKRTSVHHTGGREGAMTSLDGY